jgi:hypothetical protein
VTRRGGAATVDPLLVVISPEPKQKDDGNVAREQESSQWWSVLPVTKEMGHEGVSLLLSSFVAVEVMEGGGVSNGRCRWRRKSSMNASFAGGVFQKKRFAGVGFFKGICRSHDFNRGFMDLLNKHSECHGVGEVVVSRICLGFEFRKVHIFL